MLNKTYKVVAAPDTTYGKWPDSYGNGFYIDSHYLLGDLSDMMKEKALTYIDSEDRKIHYEEAMIELFNLLK